MDDALPTVGMTKRFPRQCEHHGSQRLAVRLVAVGRDSGVPGCRHAVVGMPSVVLAEPGQRRRGHLGGVSGSRVTTELDAGRVEPSDALRHAHVPAGAGQGTKPTRAETLPLSVVPKSSNSSTRTAVPTVQSSSMSVASTSA